MTGNVKGPKGQVTDVVFLSADLDMLTAFLTFVLPPYMFASPNLG